MRTARSLRMVVGAAVLLVLWEFVGSSGLLGHGFASLSETLLTIADRPALFVRAASSSLVSAGWGLLVGGLVGVVLSAASHVLAPLRAGLHRFAVTVHAIPNIGIAPVLIIALGRGETPRAVAALAAFFPVFVATTRAFAAAQQEQKDLFTVLGSSALLRLRYLQLPAALPGLCDALRLGAPAAVLGAVVGEWFGAPDGLGLIIVSSSSNFQIPLLWSAALLTALIAMTGFGLATLSQHAVTRRFT